MLLARQIHQLLALLFVKEPLQVCSIFFWQNRRALELTQPYICDDDIESITEKHLIAAVAFVANDKGAADRGVRWLPLYTLFIYTLTSTHLLTPKHIIRCNFKMLRQGQNGQHQGCEKKFFIPVVMMATGLSVLYNLHNNGSSTNIFPSTGQACWYGSWVEP